MRKNLSSTKYSISYHKSYVGNTKQKCMKQFWAHFNFLIVFFIVNKIILLILKNNKMSSYPILCSIHIYTKIYVWYSDCGLNSLVKLVVLYVCNCIVEAAV